MGVYETEKPKFVTVEEGLDERIEVPCVVPNQCDRIIQRPIVDVRPHIMQVPGPTEIIKEVETVDVTYEVQIPKVVPVPCPEERIEYKEVAVPHIRRVEEVVLCRERKSFRGMSLLN